MATEEDGIRAIAAEPDNHVYRLQFDDLLRGSGQDAKADFVRAEYEYHLGESDFGTIPRFNQVLRLARGLDPIWVSRVARPPVGICSSLLASASTGVVVGPQRLLEELSAVYGDEGILDEDYEQVSQYPPDLTAVLLNWNGMIPEQELAFSTGHVRTRLTVNEFACHQLPDEMHLDGGPTYIRWRENPFSPVGGMWVFAFCNDEEDNEWAICYSTGEGVEGRQFLYRMTDRTEVPESLNADNLLQIADSFPEFLQSLTRKS